MKQFLLFCFLFLFKIASSQTELQKCSTRSVVDSLMKLGKDPFAEWSNCVKGKHIPDFTAADVFGKTINTDSLKGKIVVINFWFIECHPCIAELPALNKLANEYQKKDVVFLGITYENKLRLDTAFLHKYKFYFTIIPNAKNIVKEFGQTGCPTTYIIDRNGLIKEAWSGGSIGEDATVEAYLKAKPIIDDLLKGE